MAKNKLCCTVVYATPTEQFIKQCSLDEGITVEQSIIDSGILLEFPEIDLKKQSVGIFNQIVSLNQLIKAGDRIEIYRSLVIDPKEARRLRAQK